MLLDMSQLEADRYKPTRQAFPLKEVLDELRAQFTPLAQRKGLGLRMAESDLGVYTDRHLLRRILMNLVSNAIKYTVTGTVAVQVSSTGGEVIIRVVDTGVGIPEDKIDEVFAEFVRLDESHRTDGLGIGLPIVKRAVALLGHELQLESQQGVGTTVSLTVPLSEQPVAVPGPEPVIEGKGRVIGVVENDESILFAVTQLLDAHGFEVAPAHDGAELQKVLARSGRTAPDLLISDMHLNGGRDGLALIRELKSLPAWASTLFILLTGDLDEKVAHNASSLGVVTAYKPFPPRRLMGLLDELLGKGKDTGIARMAVT